MKTTHLVAVLVGLATVALFATDTSAFYHPGLGTWMSRDPGPGGDAMRIGVTGPTVGEKFLPRDGTSTPLMPPRAEDARNWLSERRDAGSTWRDLMHDALASAIRKLARQLGKKAVEANPSLLQYADGANLYQYVRSNPIDYVDPAGLSVKCGTLSMKCPKSGTKTWDVYGCSKRAKLIFFGGEGCVTLLWPKAIFCTGTCKEIKGWQSAGNRNVSLLEHEACHACAFEDGGFFDYLGTWIPGDITDPKYCDKRPVPSTPSW